jgi:hypothetical protein
LAGWGWFGFFGGLLIGIVFLSLGIGADWSIERLWLYLLMSAMSILVGMQLIVYWVLLRVLENLSEREMKTQQDLAGYA